MEHVCNPCTWDAKVKGLQVQDQSPVHVKCQARVDCPSFLSVDRTLTPALIHDLESLSSIVGLRVDWQENDFSKRILNVPQDLYEKGYVKDVDDGLQVSY